MFTIAQITDFHLSTPDSKVERLFRTSRRLELAIEHLLALDPLPDVVLGTGDLMDHGTAEGYAIMRAMLDALPMPVHLIPGNHDSREAMITVFGGSRYLPGHGEYLQYVVEDYPLRLVGLDTIIPGATGGTLCRDRLDWLDRQLAAAPDRPTVVFMHHPPLRSGIAKMDEMGFDASDALASVLRRHGQVEAVLAGHLHRPISRRFAGTIVQTCPSTSHQMQLDLSESKKLTVTIEPPACMLHAWLGEADGLVSHVSYIGNPFPRTMLFDGSKWLQDVAAPDLGLPG